MTALAVLLVLVSAFVHATWNLLAKRSGGGAVFVWLFSVWTSVLLAPLVLAYVVVERPSLTGASHLFILGSAVIHVAYYVLLQSAYRVGDLSFVYPLVRGTSPTLATAFAITFFGERPTPLALAGAALIVLGVFALTGGHRIVSQVGLRSAIVFGILTGSFSAAYSVWDKHAVSAVLVPPLLLDYLGSVLQVVFLAPVALRRWNLVATLWRDHRREVLGVAILRPLAYILVLSALVFTPLSYVAPFREISILIGAFLGTRLLREGEARRRITAAAAMTAGAAALALG